jgi:hypothetical protein
MERGLNQDKFCVLVHKTNSKLGTRDLAYLVICRYRKHRQLACQEGEFVACFPLYVSMVHSPKLVITANEGHQIDSGFTLGETIRIGSLEFIDDRFGSWSLSAEGNDSGVVFVEWLIAGLVTA